MQHSGRMSMCHAMAIARCFHTMEHGGYTTACMPWMEISMEMRTMMRFCDCVAVPSAARPGTLVCSVN